ncbi:Golgi-associated plant pathogenesis-related protein 1-like isoform X4 [Metopolophium dirhodum]|uniref:Golgi-associated plant pathogenesis-related protein 1-like isoform X4 n=1 Tax=Metopolophium dirhodum TaxID=44670 RepID=UPI00299065DA|nr:Golgi-associated plant pathogenesis-related protein 1-like isoform X4 [Metopolophium dirhodum]
MAVNIDDSETKNVITEALDRHNFYRKKHNVPPLKINSKLNDISQNWADELAKRDVASHRPNNAYVHFTQLIWKDSSELGVGASKSSKSGKLYVVCNYDPHGNIRSQFKDQVLQASG